MLSFSLASTLLDAPSSEWRVLTCQTVLSKQPTPQAAADPIASPILVACGAAALQRMALQQYLRRPQASSIDDVCFRWHIKHSLQCVTSTSTYDKHFNA
jgi:hypothetical protein